MKSPSRLNIYKCRPYLSFRLLTLFLQPLKNCLTLVKYLPRPLKVRRRFVLKLSKVTSKGLTFDAGSWLPDSRIFADALIRRLDSRSQGRYLTVFDSISFASLFTTSVCACYSHTRHSIGILFVHLAFLLNETEFPAVCGRLRSAPSGNGFKS